MNDDLDRLEQELESWSPAPVSTGLHRRIARRLTGPRVGWLVLGALSAAAIWIAWLLFIRPPTPTVLPRFQKIGEEVTHAGQPTVWEYRAAVITSVDSLEQLMDRQTHVSSTTAALTPRAFLTKDNLLLE